jgi:two-component system chemotaxis response regulator CheB
MNTRIDSERAVRPIKVLVVDDSALVRKLLTEILDMDPEVEVVGTAMDPFIAREKIKKLRPDVLTLDVEMPKMDGLTFLANLMRLHPIPVVMVSYLTDKGADTTLQALELGAVDFVAKPKVDLAHTLAQYREELICKLKAAAGAKLHTLTRNQINGRRRPRKKIDADAIINKRTDHNQFVNTDSIIAIGASTGGTEAIKEILMMMPADAPAMVITQHIPKLFSARFAKRMDSISAMTVCEAQHGQHILTGHVYVAPGDKHLLIERKGSNYYCKLDDGPAVNRHRPAVDVLFRSVAQSAGANAVGVLLTGMGDDGAKGLKEIQDTGAATIVQDEATSVVWGMPGTAVSLGAADNVLPLEKISDTLIALTHAGTKFGT